MKKILCIVLSALCIFCTACTQTNNNADSNISIIEDVTQFSRISTDELKTIMGEPVSTEDWTYKGSKASYNFTTLSFDKNNNHYEFIIADNSVIRLTIYSENYWNGTGNRFSYNVNKKDICKFYNVSLNDNAKLVADTNFAYKLSPVNDKIAVFDIQDMDEKTYGFIKVTYNLNYFE